MRKPTTLRFAAVLAAAFLSLAVPFAAGSNAAGNRVKVHQNSSNPAIVFGIAGGNIRPWQVTIHNDGTVTATGITVRDQHLADPKNTLNGLKLLAKAAGFNTMQPQTQCTGTLPDIAGRFVEIHSAAGSKRVSVHGGCSGPFNRLWAVLYATADVSY